MTNFSQHPSPNSLTSGRQGFAGARFAPPLSPPAIASTQPSFVTLRLIALIRFKCHPAQCGGDVRCPVLEGHKLFYAHRKQKQTEMLLFPFITDPAPLPALYLHTKKKKKESGMESTHIKVHLKTGSESYLEDRGHY